MGISWSRRRTGGQFVQTHPSAAAAGAAQPPHHLLCTPPFFYGSDNPPIPVPYPQVFPPYTYPPPPPPLPCPYYSSSPGFSAPLFIRPAFPLYHLNQPALWHQHQQPSPVPPPPPPYVEHSSAKKVKNDVNVHKDTVRFEVDQDNPDHQLVCFVFDALVDGCITILYFGKEEAKCRFTPLFPEACVPVSVRFGRGSGQEFRQPSGTGIDLGFFDVGDLSNPSPAEDVFPLVISAEADPPPGSAPHVQVTQAVLDRTDAGPFHVRVVRQILCIDGDRYELRELYGIGGPAEGVTGKECVICMSDPKDTAVLPCRHVCMCRECAKELRLQSDRCPICRQPIEELMEIKVSGSDGPDY